MATLPQPEPSDDERAYCQRQVGAILLAEMGANLRQCAAYLRVVAEGKVIRG
jgi:hypothetical protein